MSRFFFLARRFVAGESLEAAVEVVRALNGSGLDVTLNMLGEGTREREKAEDAVRQYLVMLDLIRDGALKANISVKLTHLGLDIDEAYCVDNLYRILEAAKEKDVFIRLDMEGSPYTQQTLDLFYDLYGSYENTGVVIQAMLLRSPHDIFVLNKIGARVRLCKGSYREPSDLALQRMPNIRGAFLSMAEQLLKDGRFPAFATHDDYLIEGVARHAERLEVPKDGFEFQMLYGLRPGYQREMRRQGYRVRIYVPFGTEWMPYFYRRLRERRENVWFVLRNLVRR